jgi:hypothetical protein
MALWIPEARHREFQDFQMLMKRPTAIISALLFMVGLTASSAFASTSLDGAKGNIFKVDLENHSFELLKETEYDPKSDVGQSRFTVRWTDSTTITRVEERANSADVKGPMKKKSPPIIVREPIRPADLATGFWKPTLKGHDAATGFAWKSPRWRIHAKPTIRTCRGCW